MLEKKKNIEKTQAPPLCFSTSVRLYRYALLAVFAACSLLTDSRPVALQLSTSVATVALPPELYLRMYARRFHYIAAYT